MHVGRLSLVARVGALTALGLLAGVLLARVSGALWWQIVPWVLLAGLWTYLVARHRRR